MASLLRRTRVSEITGHDTELYLTRKFYFLDVVAVLEKHLAIFEAVKLFDVYINAF